MAMLTGKITEPYFTLNFTSPDNNKNRLQKTGLKSETVSVCNVPNDLQHRTPVTQGQARQDVDWEVITV